MKTHLRLFVAAAFMVLPAVAFAQADPHHPDTGTAAAAAAPALATPAPTTGGLPAQCAAMMPMMQQMMGMMAMMQGQGGMMQGQGGMMQGQGGMMMQGQGGMKQGMPTGATGMSDATKGYMSAMSMMDAPMMAGAQAGDPDVAFVKAMIPHHQGAIEMAKVVLQYGKDDKVKEWANQIIAAQEAEIAQMQAWLKEQGQ